MSVRASEVKKFLRAREAQLLLVIIVIVVLLSFLTTTFVSGTNFKSVAMGMTYDLVIAIGMTFVLILGGLDLSVGSNLALTGVVTTLILRNTMISVPLAVLCGLSLSVLIGAINGVIVTRCRINPFIVTLGMMSIARGAARVLTSGFFVTRLPESFLYIGRGEVFGIPFPVIAALMMVGLFDFLLRRWGPLNRAFHVGAHPDNAGLFGIHVSRLLLVGFMLSGFFAGVSAMFMCSRLAMGYAQFGTGIELRALAAAVIGGASLSGGRGSIWGTFLGVLLIALVNNGFVLLDISIYWQKVVTGLILVVAIATAVYQSREQK